MITIIILIGLYLIVTFFSYKFMQTAYSKDGIWNGVEPDIGTIFFTFTPIFNIMPAMDYLFGSCYKRKTNSKPLIDLNKFYKISQ